MMERIKARFAFNDLKDSSRYYFPIMDRLDNKTDVGSDFSVIFDTIMISNRAFIKLLSDSEMYAAYALVRLRLDNLTYLYAEYEHPSKVLSAAQGDETAYSYQEQHYGLFTYFFQKKLQMSKGVVTLGELFDYVKDNVVKKSLVVNGKQQTPTSSASISASDTWSSWTLGL